MRFAVGDAAADGGADAGGVLRIDKIHVEREMEAGGAVGGELDRLVHDGAHAVLVDLAHGEGVDAVFEDVGLFGLVDVAEADDDDVGGVHFGLKSKRSVSSAGPRPTMQARGMPWTLPLGLDSGVFMSAWASSQIRPTADHACGSGARRR